MAYSDYGGYAYRNGAHVGARSDAVLTPEGLKSTPGTWPGWSLEEGRSGRSFHVIIGDGPIYVCLYKCWYIEVYNLNEKLNIIDLVKNLPSQAITEYKLSDPPQFYVNESWFAKKRKPCELEVDGHKITIHWVDGDHQCQFVRLEQPDGNVWHGWSGYGVGAGLEESFFGGDTYDMEQSLLEFWPDAIANQK